MSNKEQKLNLLDGWALFGKLTFQYAPGYSSDRDECRVFGMIGQEKGTIKEETLLLSFPKGLGYSRLKRKKDSHPAKSFWRSKRAVTFLIKSLIEEAQSKSSLFREFKLDGVAQIIYHQDFEKGVSKLVEEAVAKLKLFDNPRDRRLIEAIALLLNIGPEVRSRLV